MYNSPTLFCIFSLVCTVLNAAELSRVQRLNLSARSEATVLRNIPSVNYAHLHKERVKATAVPSLIASPMAKTDTTPIRLIPSPSESSTDEPSPHFSLSARRHGRKRKTRSNHVRFSAAEMMQSGTPLPFDHTASHFNVDSLSSREYKKSKTNQSTLQALADQVAFLINARQEDRAEIAQLRAEKKEDKAAIDGLVAAQLILHTRISAIAANQAQLITYYAQTLRAQHNPMLPVQAEIAQTIDANATPTIPASLSLAQFGYVAQSAQSLSQGFSVNDRSGY